MGKAREEEKKQDRKGDYRDRMRHEYSDKRRQESERVNGKEG